jgi:putative NIF3 family GTP cyclohydrolase 1 type 2
VNQGLTLDQLTAWVREAAGISLQPDEGLRFGQGNYPVKRLLFSWIPDWAAVKEAVSWGADCLVGHESFFYPYNADIRKDRGPGWKHWPYNRDRHETLREAGIAYCRYHHVADHLTIHNSVAELLGLGLPVVDKPEFVKVYKIAAISIGELIDRVKDVFGLPAIRVALPAGVGPDFCVERVGLPWGGMGLSVNVAYVQALISEGCDVFVCGESDNMAMRFAVDQGIPVIESSHDVNEAPGWRRFAELIRDAHPRLTVRVLDSQCVWEAR